MKLLYTFIFLMLTLPAVHAGTLPDSISFTPDTFNPDLSSKKQVVSYFHKLPASQNQISALPETAKNYSSFSLKANPDQSQRAPLWKPVAEVAALNVLFMGFNRYVAKAEYGYVTTDTWKRNLTTRPEWDTDFFGINFIGHPYQGTLYFNAARTQGYSYWQSLPFAVGGSLTWEYFGENTLPSYNDMIYTPLNGAALGEILYRISTKVLDDRTTGKERALREIAAGVINPVRGFNRLLQGRTFAVTTEQLYEEEPVNLTLFAGVHRFNAHENEVFGDGGNNGMLSLQLDYGRPFEEKKRQPFDFFRLRTEFSIGKADTIGSSINNVTGYGILAGHNLNVGKLALLTGAFQYYDFWNTRNFELGALGFGGGIFSKYEVGKRTNIYTNAHLGVIPLAGNSTRSAPDSLGLRDYIYATGLQGKIESTLALSDYATLALVYYHFWLNTFDGLEGTNSIGIFRPRVTFRVFKNTSIGYEHFGYTTNRKLDAFPDQHSVVTEQKVFLQFFWEAPERRGRYN
ncbi:DUF3943 domain-containing protein [Pontibacter fetidus]|uniref:DUF3943 domain-containing protein n=1 Tax=Pontibacter fetidus TaxID=2700082 RepID=A0A6B2H4W1_9BACT|nr:DUF3943 domain-containing protein [Pontibacter fetidus]NDK55686.1 DUF3943 domain-containing protein [Pontibacter fetidus]